jgi:hypothetical protein
MPLPTPNKEESKNDFVGRCVSELSDKEEFKDNKQRVAVCYTQYDESMESKAEDQEGRMVKSSLYSIATKAQELHDMLADDQDVEAWVQDKISVSDHSIAAALDYYKHEKAMSKMDNPLETKASINDAGEMEVTIAKKYSEAEAGVYKSYMSMCASDDKMFTDTASMDDKQTYAACAVSYDKMRAMMMDDSKGELTEKQKKLPPALQKKIIEKMEKEGKYKEEGK